LPRRNHFKNAAEEKPTLNILYKTVKDIAGEGASNHEIEIASQIIAASALGLITKLALEKNIGEKQRIEIIDQFTEAAYRMASLGQNGR
jgi:hypothetical protein